VEWADGEKIEGDGMTYEAFLANKTIADIATGLAEVPALNPQLFPFQADITSWALKRGRSAIFADCGMGKSPMQLEWARHIPGDVLILAPLAVAKQTVREGLKFGVGVHYCRDQADVQPGITITNYEMLEHFDASYFTGIVLDESSILKAYDGKTRTMIIDTFARTPFKLACTATPAPNDYMELGNHAEFLGVMSRVEMLSMFFVHDGGETQQWRLKGHAEQDFWRWLASWSVMIRKPSDLGYPDDGFALPELEMIEHYIRLDKPSDGQLFPMEAVTLQERISARRDSIGERVGRTAGLVNSNQSKWVVWCNLNSESEALRKAIPDAIEVTGSMPIEEKEAKLEAFTEGRARVIISKPSIAGLGLNWQHCNRMAFVGLSDSWEQFYQAVRRCWRFGQTQPVDVHLIVAETEGAVLRNIQAKEAAALTMADNIVEHMRAEMQQNIHIGVSRTMNEYERDKATGPNWTMHLGDCVEIVKEIPSDSIHYGIFSPPFASLYTYSASDRDMGNCKNQQEFLDHFSFLVKDLHRVTMPGRLVSFHCMNLPTSKQNHGYIGIRDFRGDLIRLFESHGWIFHSEVCIWKDPVTAMQRTKALGLLYKQLKKDSAMSRQGIPDYLVTMRKPGENPERVTKTPESFPVGLWQNYASPVWMDINPSDTLQFRSARENADERHICPLQLGVIQRGIELWTNPGDTVLSPFAGIGSEGFVAIQNGRKFIGAELKRSYWSQACANLKLAKSSMGDLFDAAS
jgi:superfamily II DNA or RNA helicase